LTNHLLKIASILAACGGLLIVEPAAATPALSVDPAEILAAHNKYRAEVGVPPLRWSNRLARGAQLWAEEVAAFDQMRHSGTSGVGENLAMWYGTRPTVTQLVSLWGNERSAYRRGTFPDVSTTGQWRSVAHYTQMVWRTTTHVGCGTANNGGTVFLVCWYSPQGNFIGQVAY
jgi:hypothetical protein